MATADTTQQRLMRERARALAIVLLTRREGTDVRELDGAEGLHLVVTFPTGRKRGLRQLGVTLRYVLEPVTAEHADQVLKPFWPGTNGGPYPFPVVLFFFTMRDDGRWYSWVAEPVVTGGKTQLPLRETPDCRELTDPALEELLDRVDAWYDAHYEALAPNGAGGRRAKKA